MLNTLNDLSQWDGLLTTKLQSPPVRSRLVSRPRLMERLNQGIAYPLTVISAPAGAGKSTLLGEWLRQSAWPAAWLSLDEGDNDPVRFLRYLIAALQTLQPLSGEASLAVLRSPQVRPVESALRSLLNEITTAPDDFVLVLDDYHVINAESVHHAITFLLDYLPPPMHVMIASRVDPLLPLARLHARAQLVEMRAADLRFLPDEAAAFLNEIMGLGLAADEVAILEARTEGWIASLQLAALSLREQEDAARFIQTFAGTHRYIADYLAEEVLKQQSEATQDFLLKTSILERMTDSLCDAITGREDGQEMLEMLERRNLFVIPLDNRRQWYRYHHLFADFLRQQLGRENANMVAEFHGRASQWYDDQGLASEALHHALTAEDVTRAAFLIEKYAYTTRMRGEVSTVLAWLRALPETFVLEQPRLCLEYAWCFILTGQPDNAVPYIHAIETTLDFKIKTASRSTQNDNKQTRPLIGEAMAVWAKVACDTGRPADAIDLFQQARTYLPPDNYDLQTIISLHLGTAYLTVGNLEAAQQAYSDAVELSQASGNFNAAITALSRLGDLHLLHGQLNRADRHFRRALQLATRDDRPPTPIATHAYAGIAQILAERNQLEEAIEHYDISIRLAEQGGDQRGLAMGLLALAQGYARSGDGHQAQVVVERVQNMTFDSTQPCLNGILTIVQAQIAFILNDFERTKFWLARYRSECYTGLDRSHLLLKAHLLLKQGMTDEAAILLEQLTAKTDSMSIMGNYLEIPILRSLILEQRGKLTESEQVLSPAIQLGQVEGYIHTFTDVTDILPIMRRLLAKGIATEYITELLELMEEARHDNLLTEREMEVLNLMSAGYANKEIAQELFIAVSTVKRHIHHIYDKLDARSRTQALARAREMNLL